MATKRKTTYRRPTGSKGQPYKTHGPDGLMGKRERMILGALASAAYKHQKSLSRVEPGQSANDWRHEQVFDKVSKAGLRECAHGDFQPLLAWFQQLAGLDDKALAALMRTGKPKAKAAPGDTHEARRQLVHQISCKLTVHTQLFDRTWAELLDLWTNSSKRAWADGVVHLVAPSAAIPGVDPWPGLDPKGLNKAMARKIHMTETHGKPISEGYLVTLARGKTSRPDLDLGRDIYAGLAERCTVKQLTHLLSTLTNRINDHEGVGSKANRNKKQKTEAEKKRRSRHEIDTEPVHDPFAEARRRRGDA